MTQKSIQRAVEIVGGVSVLARALSVRPPTVSQWLSEVRPVPLERCIEIERITNGEVTVAQLRPDIARTLQTAGYRREDAA